MDSGGGPDWQEPAGPWDGNLSRDSVTTGGVVYTHIFTVVILHLAVLVSQALLPSFLVLPAVHPIPRQLTPVVALVLELEPRQAGSLARQGGGQGDESDVVTSEFPVGASSSVGVAVPDGASDLTELSPPQTLRVVHVLHSEKDRTPGLQREDLDIFYSLPSLSGLQGLALHFDPVVGVGPSSQSLAKAFIILGLSVDFLRRGEKVV